jgi:hypothetical protein
MMMSSVVVSILLSGGVQKLADEAFKDLQRYTTGRGGTKNKGSTHAKPLSDAP